MTFRAIILGLVAIVLIGAGGQYCDKYVPVPKLVRGHLPISIFGMLIVYVAAINPLLGRMRRALQLRTREIALVFAMFLAGCGITDAGLMRFFPSCLVLPLEANRYQPGWQRARLLELTPPVLLANDGRYTREVVGAYVKPLGDKGRPISVTDVPWYAWYKPVAAWSVIIIGTFFSVIALSVLVHHQWARREQIRYPLAEVATSLLGSPERGVASVLHDRVFWMGMAIPLAIHTVNGLQAWFPDSIRVPLVFDFSALNEEFPRFMATPGAKYFASPRLYPACVGLTFLLATDIGFSLGITNLLSVIAMYAMLTLGMDISHSYNAGGWTSWQTFGSFLATGAILIYIGRWHYGQTLRSALTFVRRPGVQPACVNACRLLLVCMTIVTATLIAVGLQWPLAVLAVVLTMLLFLVLGRMNAECGTFFFKPEWLVPGVLVGLFGATVLGPRMTIVLGLLMFVLMGDPFESLMPFVLNGLKVTGDVGLKTGRVGGVLAAGLVLTFAVAVPTALWADYNFQASSWGGRWCARDTYGAAKQAATELDNIGMRAEVDAWSPLQRLRHIRPDRRFLPAVAVGFVGVIACSMMRLRYTWWPLHPVVFLGFGAWTMGKYGASFFLGWLIKAIIMRLGGRGFEKARRGMIGVIVGDLAGGFLITVSMWIYYVLTGTAGPGYGFW